MSPDIRELLNDRSALEATPGWRLCTAVRTYKRELQDRKPSPIPMGSRQSSRLHMWTRQQVKGVPNNVDSVDQCRVVGFVSYMSCGTCTCSEIRANPPFSRMASSDLLASPLLSSGVESPSLYQRNLRLNPRRTPGETE